MATNPTRILLVEDDDMVREAIADELRYQGYDVNEANSASDAMRVLAQDDRFEVLFTDIRMPGDMDGWQLAKAVRDLLPNVGVLYASGFTNDIKAAVPGSLFLPKPFQPEQLRDALRKLAG